MEEGDLKELQYKEIENNKEINAYLKKGMPIWDSWDLQIIRRPIVFR